MPLTWIRAQARARTALAAELGRARKRRQSWVPRGSQPSTYSAPMIALRKLAGGPAQGREHHQPPGRVTAPAMPARNAGTSGTCSTTSEATTRSKRRPAAATPRPDRLVVDLEADLLGVPARRLDVRVIGSIPVTVAPSRASGSASRPPPQPMSSASAPPGPRAAGSRRMLAGPVADVGDPHRVELVQRRHRPGGIPPARGRAPRTWRARRDRWDGVRGVAPAMVEILRRGALPRLGLHD